MVAQARTVLWAQFRIIRNLYPRRAVSQVVLVTAMGAAWYGLWSAGAVFAAVSLARSRDIEALTLLLPWALLVGFLYWQLIPILMLSTGAAIDLRQVLVYPIPKTQLFGLDILLRLSTAFEMMIMLAGATVGLMLNPLLPWWAPAGFIPFVALNLLVAVGLRSLLSRLLTRKHVREVAILLLVLAASLPQVILVTGVHARLAKLLASSAGAWWPWTAAGSIASGQAKFWPSMVLLAWTVAAYAFGRWQFERVLRFDRDEAGSVRPTLEKRAWLDRVYRWPSALFGDPLAAMVEKEIRSLLRAPRFRLAFLMGFSFGLLIWLPMAARGGSQSGSVFADHYLTFITVYALLLLAEVTFWNCFGLDRSAVQMYYVAAVPLPSVLIAKNIAAATVVLMEASAITLVCFLLRMPLTLERLFESFVVTAVFTLYMLAIGNLGSCRYPRPIDPKQSWKSSSAARFQALLLVIYPVVAIPTGLAYVARWAFDSNAAFYATLAFDAALGGIFYWVALESAAATLDQRRESVVAALGERGGPIAA